MIRPLLAAVCFLLIHAVALAEGRVLAFERAGAVWVANLDGTGAKKLAAGSAPHISPDGTRVAFTKDAGGKTLRRAIAVVDVATGKVTVFKNGIPSDNAHRPVWSPDGTRLLFNLFVADDWHVGMVGADGSDFRFLKKAAPQGNAFWSACWAADGRRIYAQDLEHLYLFDLAGSAVGQWKLATLFPTGAFNSGASFAAAPEGQTLVMDVDMEESVTMKDWDGPPPSLWMLNLETKTATRLVPKGTFAWHGCWLSAQELLFVSQANGEKEPSIYRLSIGEKKRERVLKNADCPSVSR